MKTETKLLVAGATFVALISVSVVALLGYHLVSFTIGQRHIARAHASFEQQRYDDAIADYTRALQCSIGKPSRAYALANRGVSEARRPNGRHDDAIDDLTAASRLNGRLAYVYLERGTLYANRGNDDAAWEDYSRAIAIDRSSWAALFYRGIISARRNEWPAAIADFSDAIRAAPSSPDIYVRRALAHEQMGDLRSARASFDGAIVTSPAHVAGYLERGKFFARSRTFDRAIDDFSKALTIAPNTIDARRARAQAYAETQQWREAISDWSEILRVDPRDETALEMRGRACSWIGETDQALADLSELIRITQSGHAYELRGRAFVRAGRYQEAIDDYAIASHQPDKRGKMAKGLAWLLATCPEASVRRGPEAVEQAREACRRSDWQHWNHLDTLAAALAEVGDFEQAVEHQEQALAAKNLSAEARTELEQRLALYRAGTPYRELSRP